MKKLKIEDIVVLKFAVNNCWTNVVDAKGYENKDLIIDSENGTWSYIGWKNLKIGHSRPTISNDSGVIGVYDKTNTAHIDNLAHNVTKATRSPSSLLE